MDWSYIAGFFDGEGSITKIGNGFRITIPQANLSVLKKIKKFVRKGYIIKVTKRKKHWKDSWVYYMAKQKDINNFLKKIFPFLVVKRNLASKVLDKLVKILENMEAKNKKRVLVINKSKKLRKKGLTYRQIGKQLGIDFGYARRIILGL